MESLGIFSEALKAYKLWQRCGERHGFVADLSRIRPVREYEANLRSRELRRDGVPYGSRPVLRDSRHAPGAAGCIGFAGRPPNRLWPADTFVDFDHGLNNAVKRLRDALGDSADVPRFVETLPRAATDL